MIQWVVCSLYWLLSSSFLWYLGVLNTTIYFSNKSGVSGVNFPTNSISSNDPVIKAWEHGMVLYFMEIPDPKYPFFSKLAEFQQCMFRRIHYILTSPNGTTKIPNNRCLYVEIHCALIKYENVEVKLAHCLVQIVDYDDPYN